MDIIRTIIRKARKYGRSEDFECMHKEVVSMLCLKSEPKNWKILLDNSALSLLCSYSCKVDTDEGKAHVLNYVSQATSPILKPQLM